MSKLQEKNYHDMDGNKISLYHLVRQEPNWAMARIQEGEKASKRIAELEQALGDAMYVMEDVEYYQPKHEEKAQRMISTIKNVLGGEQ